MRILLLLGLISLGSGCNYFKNRAQDFFDVTGFNMHLSPGGLHVNARATKYFQAGYGVERFRSGDAYERRTDTTHVGWSGRDIGAWRVQRWEAPMTIVPFPFCQLHHIYREEIAVTNPAFETFADNLEPEMNMQFGEDPWRYASVLNKTDRWLLEFGGSFTAIFIGAEAFVRPFEVFDFVFGLIGLDFSEDDL